ncbi:MAG: MoaD/ThiS family protein, partial [Anaerolineales bacterium]
MPNAFIRFYAELNDFLPAPQRQTTSVVPIQINTTVKHLIESLGVPHTEIDLILVNSEAVDFTYRVQDGDRISVYPVFESLNIAPVT